MGGTLVPDNINSKLALESTVCTTQLDGLVMIQVNGELAMHDVDIFCADLKWTRNLHIWVEARPLTVGKDSKTVNSNRGMTVIFVVNKTVTVSECGTRILQEL